MAHTVAWEAGPLDTTRYRSTQPWETFDGNADADAVTPDARSAVVVTDAWIDDSGLPRRVTLSGENEGTSIESRMDISPREGPIDVSLPPENVTASVESADIVHAVCLFSASPSSVVPDPSRSLRSEPAEPTEGS